MKRYGILDTVQGHDDLCQLSYDSLAALCVSLREFIVDHVSQTGGHLASNLGVVELAVALEREFDSAKDRIIYDVGHQCYVHKIFTGRRDQFESLRQYGGLSGFLRPDESDTDPCISGHASSSVSVALGMAHARTLKNQKYHVVAVIGDGAMTGGMAYEALNSIGGSGEPLLVVLNDNNMSIAKNVGGLNRHLSRLRVHPRYLRAKTNVKATLSRIPGGKTVSNTASRMKMRLKKLLLPNSLFEQMGLAYLGPVDGHDLKSICELLAQAKKMKKPVLLHVMTRKGKGYLPSEQSPEQYHGVSKFNIATGASYSMVKEDFSAHFGKELCALAEKDGRICAITAAMPSGTGLTAFSAAFPNRFFDVGIAEEHAVAMAAGMAKQGLKPVVAVYSTFLQRAYDQLIHDVAIEGLPVVLMVDRAGIVGADGETHNGVFDVAFLRSIPGVKIYAPASFAELRTMFSQAIYRDSGPVAIRYPRGGEGMFDGNTAGEAASCVHRGERADAVIICYGILVNDALAAADMLAQKGLHTLVYKLNRLDGDCGSEQMWKDMADCPVVIVEDVVPQGSCGQAIAQQLAQRGMCNPVRLLNTQARFLPHGDVSRLHRLCGIDAQGIAHAVTSMLEERGRE